MDTEALDRSQRAIDEGNEAAKEAMKDPSVDSDLQIPAAGADADSEQEEVTPRPS